MFGFFKTKVLDHKSCRYREGEHLVRAATRLAKATTFQQAVEISVEEAARALDADAVTLYLLEPDQRFKLIHHLGATPEFLEKCSYVNRDHFQSLKGDNLEEVFFIGTPEEFASEVPTAVDWGGRSKRTLIAFAPMVTNGKLIGLLGFSYLRMDVRPHRSFVLTLVNLCAQAIDGLRNFEQERHARKEAEAANKAKTDFLANINHEIRTPAGVIFGFTSLLNESRGLTEEQRKWVNIIYKNIRQLNNIIGEVLDLAKVEMDKVVTERVAFSISEVIYEIQTAMLPEASRKGLKLNAKIASDVDDVVMGDPTLFRQVITNLVGNSIKFTSTGIIEIYCTRTTGGQLICQVSDTGLGIASDQQKRIFDPFFQADNSTRRKYGGTGLGLTISRNLARTMGGDLNLVSSTVGQGSVFQLNIPYEPAGQSFPRSSEKKSSLDLTGLKTLLVEDSEDNQLLIRHILTKAGALVESAFCGVEGVKLASEKKYDVILMDIQMPEMDGFEAVAELRQRSYTGPIVALTAHAIQGEKERALKLGFDDYLTKPIDTHRLTRTLREVSTSPKVRQMSQST